MIVFSTLTKQSFLRRTRQERLSMLLVQKTFGQKVCKRHFRVRLFLVLLPIYIMFFTSKFYLVNDLVSPLWTSVTLLEVLQQLLLKDS